MADAQVEVTPLTATLEESTAKSHGADSSAFNRMKMLGNLGDKYFLDDPAYITQLEFFKQATKIEDPLELKRYILRYAQEAYTIFPYPCIWGESYVSIRVRDNLSLGLGHLRLATIDSFLVRSCHPTHTGLTFCCGKVASHPVYTHVLELGKVTEGDHQPIFLDIGTFCESLRVNSELLGLLKAICVEHCGLFGRHEHTVGTDIQQLVSAGYNEKSVLGVDLVSGTC